MVIRRITPAAVLFAACLGVGAASAQGIASDRLIDSVTVTAERQRPEREAPSPMASKTSAELRLQNLINPEDALKYVPNLTIRKRYIGDRNALLGGRSFSTLQSARGLVLMDGYLLSNFLGRFDAPRWSMIAPEEIERVDVLYGPYSALYPGNSIGTTVAVRTRRPEDFELGLRTTTYIEQFDEYGFADEYTGYQVSAFLGDRFENGAWFSLAANRQSATSHPMQYYTISANESGEFAPLAGDAIAVTGVKFDTNPQGRRRAIFGANAGAIDRTVQDLVKLRGGQRLADWLEADGFLAVWRSDTTTKNRTFMRNAAGEEVWSGRVSAGDVIFDVPPTALAPSAREERHLLWGATMRTTRPSGWNASLVFSEYEIHNDAASEASRPDPFAAHGGPGTRTERDGTGWQTFEAQAVHTPTATDWTHGTHTLALGLHRNDYQLYNPVYLTADWRSPSGTLAQNVGGETRVQAVYLQDEWELSSRWSLTLGLRYEDWDAFNGEQRAGAITIDYPGRSDTAISPKASLTFQPNRIWSFRLSAGRGVRFPTVSELFQGTVTPNAIVLNDPSLEAEMSDSFDFTLEKQTNGGDVRVSLFEDDVRDSIFAQTDITVTPNVTNVQNVDLVRTRGVEAAWRIDRIAAAGLSLEGNVAYTRTRIIENGRFPISVGNRWPRVPAWRGNVQAVWRPNASWLTSVGLRYSGRMYNSLENDDVHPDTYGGVSRFATFDARVAYTFANGLELAIGIDNMANERSYQYHPLPMRTVFAEARWSLQEKS